MVYRTTCHLSSTKLLPFDVTRKVRWIPKHASVLALRGVWGWEALALAPQ